MSDSSASAGEHVPIEGDEHEDRTARIDRPGTDDPTVVSPRRARDDPEATVTASGAPGDSDESEPFVPGPRRRSGPAGDPGAPDAIAEEGSTMVVRRESRRRALRSGDAAMPEPSADTAPAHDTPIDGAPRTVRVAREPRVDEPLPVPTPPEPAIVARTPPAPRARQDPVDAVAAEASVRARARRRALVFVLAASAVLVAAVTALVLLTTGG